jgi:hypothetical protein
MWIDLTVLETFLGVGRSRGTEVVYMAIGSKTKREVRVDSG